MGLIDDQAGQLYESLVNQAIEGSDSFFAKREKIDEYGWRNYGDLYGDHEAVYHKGPTPMISHYNNQYDCVLGFFYQFMRSGDQRGLILAYLPLRRRRYWNASKLSTVFAPREPFRIGQGSQSDG
jgi:hypothetical protein